MPADNRDTASLWDMVKAIYRIQEFTANLTCDTYLDSALVQSAVETTRNFRGSGWQTFRRISANLSRDQLAQNYWVTQHLDPSL
jgi:hypothetical protein